jgi:transposase
LKALAVREKKIHLVGSPALKIEGTPVYLDVEGLPDKDFYYLIGMRIVSHESTMHHSLWADNDADEKNMWNDFLCILSNLETPVLICYGSYEKVFLKAMCERYGEPQKESPLSKAIKSPLNILSFLYGQVYFPTFSNGLKEIAGHLGYTWTNSSATGVQAIVWRQKWTEGLEPFQKQQLVCYNREDCEALELVTEKLLEMQQIHTEKVDSGATGFIDITSMKREHFYGFKRNSFFFPEMDIINKAAYWDYQREKIFLKSNRYVKNAVTHKPYQIKTMQPNQQKVAMAPTCCVKCNSTSIGRRDSHKKIVYDLKFVRGGVRRWIVQYKCYRWLCKNCGSVFVPKKKAWAQSRLGTNAMAYAVYQNIGLRLPQETVDHEFCRLFGLPFKIGTTWRIKEMAASYYAGTYERLLMKLHSGALLHADETKISLKNKVGFVWVFANMEEVAYVFSETREGNVLQDYLKNFKGVLVSDFYAAYDGINCPQQKCLVHLLRDLNDELLKHPYDEELKQLVKGFANLVKPMIDTVDRHGLKSRFLKKHIVCVNRFYRELFKMKFFSELAVKYKKRFEKNRNGLFTFLEHDGVPWNNNNAEHAVKAFAMLRHVIKGVTSEKGLKDYLILLSICETCKYKGIDFLDFLISGEKDIDVFAQRKVKRKIASPT